MREKSVFLEDRVYVSLVGGNVVDPLAHEDYVALVGLFESADHAESRRLAAAGRSQQRDEFVVVDIQIDTVENLFTVKRLAYVLEFDDLFHDLSPHAKK